MLKELIESSLYITYPPKAERNINIDEATHLGDFTMCDPQACKHCTVCIRDAASRKNLHIITAADVHSISVDKVMSHTQEDVGESCDYLLADDDTVVLTEMTCAQSTYVAGNKREKARRQLLNTLEVFYTNSNIRSFCAQRQRRYIIFSWKDTGAKADSTDLSEQNFLPFTGLCDETYSPDNIQHVADFDFFFKEIRYPDPLHWDKLQ